jgi:hypothetical protein
MKSNSTNLGEIGHEKLSLLDIGIDEAYNWRETLIKML